MKTEIEIIKGGQKDVFSLDGTTLKKSPPTYSDLVPRLAVLFEVTKNQIVLNLVKQKFTLLILEALCTKGIFIFLIVKMGKKGLYSHRLRLNSSFKLLSTTWNILLEI